MRRRTLEIQRKWFGFGLLALIVLAVLWHFSPGLPVLFGPYASASSKQAGLELFMHEWQPNDSLAQGDGLGPVFNAKSCVACHNQGGVGGGGSNAHNVFNFEVMPNERDTEFVSGTIHAEASSPQFRESFALVRAKYPIIKGRVRANNDGHCGYVAPEPDVDPLHTGHVQTTALWGAGWVDRISSKSILRNQRTNMLSGIMREFQADFDAIPAGRARSLPNGKIGKFGWKAQFATLEEFVAAACANELGLGTPASDQAVPIGAAYPEVKPDLNRKQFRQLVAFVDTLPKPVEALPASGPERDRAVRGKELFAGVGCAVCHVPDMGGVRGVYSDFLLHRITDPTPQGGRGYGPQRPDTPLPRDFPHEDEWKTPALWGVADSAPYLHDGSAVDLPSAILKHGGDAKPVREAYRRLGSEDQQALIAFLKSLKAPPDAVPVTDPAIR
jgi:mono/diheme cytochrome c family protein